MSSQTIYIKIDKNVLVHNRNITLGDIAKIECTDVGMLRKIRQKKVYSFQGTHAKKNQFQVFSILKIIQLIHEDYPNADVQNEGEADFIGAKTESTDGSCLFKDYLIVHCNLFRLRLYDHGIQ